MPHVSEQPPNPSRDSQPDDANEIAPVLGESKPSPRQNPAYYVFVVIAVYLCMMAAPLNPVVASLGSGLAAAACCMAFTRVNPRLVGLLLIGFTLGAYPSQPRMAVLWMLASVMAGGTMALLLVRRAREDDFYFIPTAVAAIGFVVLLGLANGLSWIPAFEQASLYLAQMRTELAAQVQAVTDGSMRSPFADPEQLSNGWALLEPHIEAFAVMMIIGFWGLCLWLASRVARRLTGHLVGTHSAIMLFRIRVPYIFLLILGLFLEILSSLYAWEALSYVAWPVLIWFAIACFVEGLGVLLFIVALRQASGRRRSAKVLGVAGLILLFLRPEIGSLIGLTDIWFDFRKLNRIEETMDLED